MYQLPQHTHPELYMQKAILQTHPEATPTQLRSTQTVCTHGERKVGSSLCDLLVFYRDKATDLCKGSTAAFSPYIWSLWQH